MFHHPLQKTEKLISGGIRTLARTLHDHLIGTLRTSGPRTTYFAGRFGLVTDSSCSGELNTNSVAILQAVDLATLLSNQLTVVLSRDLQNMCGLILQLLAHVNDPSLGSIGLSLGSLDLNLATVHLDVNVKFVAQLVDILAPLANKEVGILLREIARGGVSSFKVIFLLLDHEFLQARDQVLHRSRRTTK